MPSTALWGAVHAPAHASGKVVQTDHIAGILAAGQRLSQQRMGGKVITLFPGHQAHKAVQGIAAAAIAAGGTGLCRELSHHIPHDLPQAVTGCHKAVEGVGGVTGGSSSRKVLQSRRLVSAPLSEPASEISLPTQYKMTLGWL